MLIDGGGWRAGDLGGRVLVPSLAALGVRALDAVVVTHPDHDHCGGLRDLVDYLPVAELWTAPVWLDDPCVEALGRRRRRRALSVGQELAVGRWRLKVLHPDPEVAADAGNDASVVLLASVHGRSVLLTGDIEAAAERRLQERWGEGLAADLLKVAHHGSRTSTGPGFLYRVAPRWAWISAGRGNPFGHPAAPVVRRLEARDIVVLRTDLHGQLRVRVTADGVLAFDTARSPGII